MVSDASSCPEIAAPGGEYRVAKLAEEAAEVSAGARKARVRSRNAQNVNRHFNPPVPNAIHKLRSVFNIESVEGKLGLS